MKKLATTTALAATLALVPAVAAGAADAPSGHTCLGQPATIVGTGAGEILFGTQGDDVIQAYGGNDKVYGLGGDDVICGGGGKDKVRGGKGDDTVGGSKGDDLVWGGPGDDRLLGGAGNDRLFGRLHNDVIKGQAGRDKCRQDTRLEGGTGRVVDCEVPMTTSTTWVPHNRMDSAAGFRVKGDNTGGEVYLGSNLGSGGDNRVEANYNALKAGGTFAVSVSFDAAENRLDGSVGTIDLSYDFDEKVPPGCAVDEWDLVQVSLWERVEGVELSFEGGSVNGVALKKDMEGVSGGTKTWTIEGIDFSTDWTVEGDLIASGAEWTGGERTKLELMVGCKLDPQVAS